MAGRSVSVAGVCRAGVAVLLIGTLHGFGGLSTALGDPHPGAAAGSSLEQLPARSKCKSVPD